MDINLELYVKIIINLLYRQYLSHVIWMILPVVLEVFNDFLIENLIHILRIDWILVYVHVFVG